jgi:hypothetical protein
MTTQEMNTTINNRINELIESGAKKEMIKKGMNEEAIKNELYSAAVCSLLGIN